MKKRTLNILLTALIIFLIISVVAYIKLKPASDTDAETAKCIGEKATLYIQLGCSHCQDQEELFGNSFQHIKSVDCFFERDKCLNISYINSDTGTRQNGIVGTPTWIIDDTGYVGVQTIEQLKTLTGC